MADAPARGRVAGLRSRRGAWGWLLVLPALAGGTFAALFAFELVTVFDRPMIAAIGNAAPALSPAALLHVFHRVDLLYVMFIWFSLPALAVMFVLGARLSESLIWTFSLAVLSSATCFWFAAATTQQTPGRWISALAAILVLCGIAFGRFVPYRRSLQSGLSVLAMLLLVVPALCQAIPGGQQPPEAQKIWSTELQKDTWEAMNTGSEYDSLRQVVFVGDRVVAIFNAGSAGYQGKQPMSRYRLVSLDSTTGAKRNEVDFTARWGAMPLIHATRDNLVSVDSQPLRILGPDLSPALARQADAVAEAVSEGSAKAGPAQNCEYDPRTAVESEPATLSGCGAVVIVNPGGKMLAQDTGPSGPGKFAGVSRDGSHFALEFSGEEGDPSIVLYERFRIYSTATGAAIATVRITHMPERQSWSAFSPNGKYFAAGSPRELALYRLP